ncbi:MAG: NAD(P)H-quinone oxidoreductase subunit 2, chloroplastic [Phycisphaerae bacterium]|nr:NAD(P)H-quinone oxidoreductase subunit 2, chloroplastic [Phycisphaerae bacterium]
MNWSQYINALLPEMVMMLAGCMCLFFSFAAGRPDRPRRWAPPFALLATAGVLVLSIFWRNQPVNDPAFVEFSGVLVTSLSHYLRLLTLTIGLVLILVNWYQGEADEQGEYFALLLLAMSGVMLLSVANDLILLFFAIELISVPTYVLVAISRTDVRAQEAAGKYFFLGAMAAALTAYGLSLLYGAAGTTLMSGDPHALRELLATGQVSTTPMLLGILLVVGGLCFKIAAVPFHAYVADVYQGASAPLVGVLAFLPKLGGFAALVQILGLYSWGHWPLPLQWALWGIAALTMTAGNVLALMQTSVKRILAYSSIAHSGYMLIGLLVGPGADQSAFDDGLSAMFFYIAVYGVMNLGAFAVLSALTSGGNEPDELQQLNGLSKSQPALALAMAICCFSLMGLPPTAGMLGKVYIFSSAFSAGSASGWGYGLIVLAVIGVLNSAIGAAYYLRIVGQCYLETSSSTTAAVAPTRGAVRLAVLVCACSMLVWFVCPHDLLREANRATASIASPTISQSSHTAKPPIYNNKTFPTQ